MNRRLFAICAPSVVVGATVAFVGYETDNIFFKGKNDFLIRGLSEEIKIDEKTAADKAEPTPINGMYDYIVCGSGPGAAAWLRTTLKAKPNARILLLERGPYCKTDILTESNPVRCFLDSKRIIAEYNHGVMQVAITC